MTSSEALKVAIEALSGRAVYANLSEAAAQLERLARFVPVVLRFCEADRPLPNEYPASLRAHLRDAYRALTSTEGPPK